MINFFNIIFVPSKLNFWWNFSILYLLKQKNDYMKIYQTTIKMIDLVPETNEIKSLLFDTRNDIKLTTEWNEAFLNHINLVNQYANKEIYYVSSIENKKINDSIVTIIEWAPPIETITKIIIETIVKEIN